MVLKVRRLLLLPFGEVHVNVFIRDVALLCNQCDATRASGALESVEFERGAHDASAAIRVYPSNLINEFDWHLITYLFPLKNTCVFS